MALHGSGAWLKCYHLRDTNAISHYHMYHAAHKSTYECFIHLFKALAPIADLQDYVEKDRPQSFSLGAAAQNDHAHRGKADIFGTGASKVFDLHRSPRKPILIA